MPLNPENIISEGFWIQELQTYYVAQSRTVIDREMVAWAKKSKILSF